MPQPNPAARTLPLITRRSFLGAASLAAVFLMGATPAHAQKAKRHPPRIKPDPAHQAVVIKTAVSQKQAGGLRIGMTRAEVCRLYSPDGGLSSQIMQKFIYANDPTRVRQWSMVSLLFGPSLGTNNDVLKINVHFAPADPKGHGDWMKDVVVSFSAPYAESMYFD